MDKTIEEMMKRFSDMMDTDSSSQKQDAQNSSFDFSKISPEMLNNFASFFQGASPNSNTASQSRF